MGVDSMNNLSYQRGRRLKLSPTCSIRHPTLSEIESLDYEEYCAGKVEKYGYERYLQLLLAIILNPKDIADILWFEQEVWYEDITSDWDFFLTRAIATTKQLEVELRLDSMNQKATAMALDGELKDGLRYFLGLNGEFIFIQKAIDNSDKKQIFLCNTKQENGKNIVDDDCFKFTECSYNILVDFLKKINWIKDNYEFVKGGNKYAKRYILQNQYKKRKKAKKTDIDISTINSALIANKIDTWNMPIYEFYECYYRLAKIDEYKNTMSALYSGNIDTKKNPINWDKINWSSAINI